MANTATEIGARVNPQFITNDGKILAIGQFGIVNGVFLNGIFRFNSDGSIDPTFPLIQEIFSTAPLIQIILGLLLSSRTEKF